MPDTPVLSGRWLNPEEIRYLEIQTYIKEGGRSSMEATEKFKWSYLTDLLTDYKIYLQAFILFTASVCAYGKAPSRRLTSPVSDPKSRPQVHNAFDHEVNGLYIVASAAPDNSSLRRGCNQRCWLLQAC